MNNTLIFFCISCCLLIFNIIEINTAVGNSSFRDANCQRYSDRHKYVDEKNSVTGDLKNEFLKFLKEGQHFCERQKASYGLKYASIISNIFFGVLCSLLSLLHIFGKGNYFEKVTGIIGLACGIIGFILTLIYIIYSGYIFTNDGPGKSYSVTLNPSSSPISHFGSSSIIKLDKERAFAELKDNVYKCLYYDANNEDSFYAKYSDLGKKQYNYHKDFEYADPNSEYKKCNVYNPSTSTSNPDPLSVCAGTTSKINNCNKLYFSGNDAEDEISHKYQYDNWVTSIIFGCFIIAINIGLAIFGFLLFSQTEGSSGHVAVK